MRDWLVLISSKVWLALLYLDRWPSSLFFFLENNIIILSICSINLIMLLICFYFAFYLLQFPSADNMCKLSVTYRVKKNPESYARRGRSLHPADNRSQCKIIRPMTLRGGEGGDVSSVSFAQPLSPDDAVAEQHDKASCSVLARRDKFRGRPRHDEIAAMNLDINERAAMLDEGPCSPPRSDDSGAYPGGGDRCQGDGESSRSDIKDDSFESSSSLTPEQQRHARLLFADNLRAPNASDSEDAAAPPAEQPARPADATATGPAAIATADTP